MDIRIHAQNLCPLHDYWVIPYGQRRIKAKCETPSGEIFIPELVINASKEMKRGLFAVQLAEEHFLIKKNICPP